ncbi:hypothetical protein Tco_0851890 [Tanacetum coccineum]
MDDGSMRVLKLLDFVPLLDIVIAVVWCSSRVIIACDWAVLLLGHGILIDVMLEVLFVITTSTAATKQQEMWKQVIVQKWDLLYDRYTGLKYYYCYVHESTARCDQSTAEKIKGTCCCLEVPRSVNAILDELLLYQIIVEFHRCYSVSHIVEDFVKRHSDHYMKPTEFEIQEMVNILVSGEAY